MPTSTVTGATPIVCVPPAPALTPAEQAMRKYRVATMSGGALVTIRRVADGASVVLHGPDADEFSGALETARDTGGVDYLCEGYDAAMVLPEWRRAARLAARGRVLGLLASVRDAVQRMDHAAAFAGLGEAEAALALAGV